MRGHLDGDVGIVAEHVGQRVEGGFALGTQSGAVKIVEDVFDHDGLVDGGQEEVDVVLGVFLGDVRGELLACVEEALRAGQHHVGHAAAQGE